MNIIDKIKVGDTLYSPVTGEVTITKIDPKDRCCNNIMAKSALGFTHSFDNEGKYFSTGEYMLFPSKENRDWSTYSPKFNINTLNPFDKVLVRDDDTLNWTATYYSHKEEDMFICAAGAWCQCIPYNDNTKHLVGTTKMPDDRYINW